MAAFHAYELRLVDKDGRKVASVWTDCADDAAAAIMAADEASKYRVERSVGYELRLGRRLIAFTG